MSQQVASELLDRGRLEIKCLCNKAKKLSHNELRQIVEPGLFALYLQKSVEQAVAMASDMGFCPTPDCTFAYIKGPQLLNCPLCGKSTCVECGQAWHGGMTCAENQINNRDESVTVAHLKDLHMQKCTKCNFWVERSAGCDHMSCRCGHQFCYKCGAEWGSCHGRH